MCSTPRLRSTCLLATGRGPRPPLDSVSQRILKHYKLVAPAAVEPSLLVVQAPIFHGHAFSVYIEMEKAVALETSRRF